MPRGVAQRVVQIHATRRCNLRCLHCYSSSSPQARDELASSLLGPLIDEAAAEGYTIAGFSGGEPTLHPALPSLVARARSNGLYTTVTTNGMLLTRRLVDELASALDLLAVSLDGVKASHERIRDSDRAFDAMVARLPLVRDAGVPLGFIFTLTQHNVHELDAVAAFAAEQGARLLTVHPLELVGRAERELGTARPDGIELAAALLEVRRLAEMHAPRMLVRLDVFDRVTLREHPNLVYADEGSPAADAPLADLVAPLVVEPDGWVVPVEYGFPRALALGSLRDAPLASLAAAWRRGRYAAFREHCRATLRDVGQTIVDPTDRLFNWYEAVLRDPAQH